MGEMMTENNIQQILASSLRKQGADILTQRTLTELLKFNDRFDGSVEWRDQIIAVSDTFYHWGRSIAVLHILTLAIIEDHWEEFDQAWRDVFDDDILTFAFKRYQRKPQTIRADLRAVRTFILGERVAKPFGTVEVPKRGPAGQIVRDERGEIITEHVEWNPLRADLSKMKVAVPLVEQGKLDRKTWSMMMDDKVSSSQMIKKIYESSEDDPHPPQLGIKFGLVGPVLVAYENGSEVELGELNWEEYYEKPYSLKHRAMDKLLALLGLTLDEQVTMYRAMEENNDAYYSDK